MTARLLDYGDRAVLVELDDSGAVSVAWRTLVAETDPAVRGVVPAARTILVEFVPGALSAAQRRAWVAGRLSGHTEAALPTRAASQNQSIDASIEIEVRYDGADLGAVATEIGESVAAVVARHTARQYQVLFCGFSPGFAYLVGGDPRLQVPRLTSPRPTVPAGSVAIAAEFTGIYPRSSPGGWRLLGRTDAVLFDPERPQPALLAPGTLVRFRPA